MIQYNRQAATISQTYAQNTLWKIHTFKCLMYAACETILWGVVLKNPHKRALCSYIPTDEAIHVICIQVSSAIFKILHKQSNGMLPRGEKKALYYILKYQKTKLCHLKPQKSLTQIGPTNNSNITVNNITILGRMQSGRICCITSTHQLWRLQRTNYLSVWHIKDSFDHAHIFWSFLFHKNGKISYLTMSMKT